jgi:hypothetical protein
MKVSLHNPYVIAVQVTELNLQQVADFTGGAIKGISLPAADQEVEFYEFGEEQRAQVGDWIVRIGLKGNKLLHLKVPPEYMPFIFKEHIE